VLHSDDGEEYDDFRGGEWRDGGRRVGQVGMGSLSTHTAVSHVVLPTIRNARGERVVGRTEPDDDRDSIRASPKEWV
jgi:hypothetical protein